MRLFLLGPPRLEAAGRPVSFDTRKALALLAYLTLHDPQHRDVLGGLLWPSQDAAHARGALRRTLSAVKRAVPEDALVVTRDLVGIKQGALWVDALECRAVFDQDADAEDAAPDRLEAALDLAGGDFMEGFGVRDAPSFDTWISVERESWQRALGRALARITERLARAGEPERAVEYARRRVELDPLDEPAHRALMELFAAAGDRSAALRQYEACARILDDELSVAPLPETTALYESLRGTTSPAVPAGAPEPPAPAPRLLPFVGRGEELTELRRSLASGAALLAIEGEAGIGKTRLAQELVATTDRQAFEVRAHEEERDHPFGALARLIRTILDEASVSAVLGLEDRAAAEVARLVPEVRQLRPETPPADPLDGPGARTAFFEGIWDAVADLAERGSLLLFEDVHWIDEGTLGFLLSATRRTDDRTVALCLTWRKEEVPRDHLLRRAMRDARPGGPVAHLVLGRLSPRDVEVLVADVLPDAGAEVARRLYEESAGVPFYIAEFLRAGAASGASSVADFIRSQVTRLGDLSGQVLTAAAVIGGSADASLLQAVAGRTGLETVEAVEDLVDRGLLVERREGYDFAHEKVRQVVYDDTSLARRRVLHSRAHDHLVGLVAQRPETVAMAAHHARMAGRDAEAASLYEKAGAEARSLYANAEAVSHLENAVALGHRDVARLQEEIGDLQTLLGRYGDALESYRSALVRDPEERWRLEHRLGTLHLRRGEPHLARTHLGAAWEAVPSHAHGDRARIAADMAVTASHQDEPDGALAHASTALSEAEQAGDPAALAQVHNILGMLASEPAEAIAHLTRSVDLSARVGDPQARVAALNNLALALRREGRVDEAIGLTREALALCSRLGDVHREAALHNNLADSFHAAGDAAAWKEHSRAAAALFAAVGEEGVMTPEIWKLVEW